MTEFEGDMMKNLKMLAAPIALGLTLALSGGALYAQPDPNEAPNAQNPPNQGPGGGGGGGRFRNMTPEQRAQMQQQMQQRREQGLHQVLTAARFTEAPLQNAIVDFVNQQDTAGQAVQEKARLLGQALRDPAATDAQVAPLLADFRAAVAAEKARRATALKELDADISYTKSPRLDALLTMLGIIGDESSIMGGMGGLGGGRGGMGMGGFGGGPGGFGGFGGGGGGRRRGGQGGGQGDAN